MLRVNRFRRIVKLLIVVVAFLTMGVTNHVPPSALTQGLENTAWLGDGSNGVPFVLEIRPNRELVHVDSMNQIRHGTWRLLGTKIDVLIDEESVTLAGNVEGTHMSGSASIGSRHDLQWSAVQQPVVVAPHIPEYPALESAARLSGNVMVELIIDAPGKVSGVHAITGHPSLRRLSEEAAKLWQFSTADENGFRKSRLVFSFRLLEEPDEKVRRSIFRSPYRVEVRRGTPSVESRKHH